MMVATLKADKIDKDYYTGIVIEANQQKQHNITSSCECLAISSRLCVCLWHPGRPPRGARTRHSTLRLLQHQRHNEYIPSSVADLYCSQTVQIHSAKTPMPHFLHICDVVYVVASIESGGRSECVCVCVCVFQKSFANMRINSQKERRISMFYERIVIYS